LVRPRVHGIRYRRLSAPDHWLARGSVDAYGSGPGCPGTGDWVALPARGRYPTFEPRIAIAVGDSYDNSLAETILGLCKTEVIHHRGPWKNLDEVEFATLEWVDWFNNRRLLEPIGIVPPAEFEIQYLQQQNESAIPP